MNGNKDNNRHAPITPDGTGGDRGRRSGDAAGDQTGGSAGGGKASSSEDLRVVDGLLKRPAEMADEVVRGEDGRTRTVLFRVGLFCFLVYGLIMGSFSGQSQLLASPAKVAVGMALSALLCYPSFYIFSCLTGADIRPGQAFSLLLGTLALISVLLLGFAPVAFIFTVSVETVSFMGFIHLAIWVVSFFIGLRYAFVGLKAMKCRANGVIAVWGLILLVTMFQMSTTLRPVLGTSEVHFTAEKKFFLAHWFDSMEKDTKASREKK